METIELSTYMLHSIYCHSSFGKAWVNMFLTRPSSPLWIFRAEKRKLNRHNPTYVYIIRYVYSVYFTVLTSYRLMPTDIDTLFSVFIKATSSFRFRSAWPNSIFMAVPTP